MRRTFHGTTIELHQGDITRLEVDAIVNAANSELAGGGGVDGAIHAAAGSALMEETSRRYPDGCPTGSAVATAGGRLDAKYVFHAVGPVWKGGQQNEEQLLRSAVARCLELAHEHECDSIAFPAISTGVYSYPLDLAAETMLDEIILRVAERDRPARVIVALFGEGAFGQFARVLESCA